MHATTTGDLTFFHDQDFTGPVLFRVPITMIDDPVTETARSSPASELSILEQMLTLGSVELETDIATLAAAAVLTDDAHVTIAAHLDDGYAHVRKSPQTWQVRLPAAEVHALLGARVIAEHGGSTHEPLDPAQAYLLARDTTVTAWALRR